MTVGPANGEPDDPYGYLYRPGPGQEPPPSGATPGRVMPQYVQVGQTQPGVLAYGQPQPSQPPVMPQQAGPQEPQQPPGGGRRSGDGGKRSNGPLFAVLGVVLVVAVVAVAVLMLNGDGDKGDKAASTATVTQEVTTEASNSTGPTATTSAGAGQFGRVEAENAQLSNLTAGPGGKGASGSVVVGWQNGSSLTWVVDAPEKGSFNLVLQYNNPAPAKDPSGNRSVVHLTMAVDGKANSRPVNLYGLGNPDAIGDTWGMVELKKGVNTITVTCTEPAGCPISVDSLHLQKGTPK
jgi:hypothetical protein